MAERENGNPKHSESNFAAAMGKCERPYHNPDADRTDRCRQHKPVRKHTAHQGDRAEQYRKN
jgi:hypothetical protein